MCLMDNRICLAVAAHADGRQHRDVGGLPVQPRADHRAVEGEPLAAIGPRTTASADDVLLREAARAPRVPVDLHLAPGAADDVLADRALEQAVERPLDAPRVGPGKINRGDQRLGPLRQPLVARQRLGPPFGGPAVLALDAGTRHADGLCAEDPDELTLATSVAMALARAAAAAVADAAEKRREFLVEQRLDGRAHRLPQPVLDRIGAGLAKQ